MITYLAEHWEQWRSEDQGFLAKYFEGLSPEAGGNCTGGRPCGFTWLAEGQINSIGLTPSKTWLTHRNGAGVSGAVPDTADATVEPPAAAALRTSMWHWPTFKPEVIRCYLQAISNGTWPIERGGNLSAWLREKPAGPDSTSGCHLLQLVGGGR